ELYQQCLKEDVLITPGSFFAPSGLYDQWIRLSYAAAGEDEIIQGVKIMGRILKEKNAPHIIQPLF
ncbi:MAG: hypothetical protein PHD92_08350, partial [Eubacteriales bacterium]|nr:hypothetical protein [Eubacteriales bacterium]